MIGQFVKGKSIRMTEETNILKFSLISIKGNEIPILKK